MSRNASFGAAALVDFDRTFAIGQDTIILTGSDNDMKFVETALRSRLVQLEVERYSSGTTFGRINLGDLRALGIPLPDLEQQKSAARSIEALEYSLAGETDALSKLRHLRTGLVPTSSLDEYGRCRRERRSRVGLCGAAAVGAACGVGLGDAGLGRAGARGSCSSFVGA